MDLKQPHSTVILVVGDEASHVIGHLADLPELAVYSAQDEAHEIIQHCVKSTSKPFVTHDDDPLGHVAAAWVEFFENQSTQGVLEAEIELAINELDAGNAVFPDFYFVLEPQNAPLTWQHWWLGVLADVAPLRVLPTAATPEAVIDNIRHLPVGRYWQDPHDWLPRVPYVLPDRAGLPDRAAQRPAA